MSFTKSLIPGPVLFVVAVPAEGRALADERSLIELESRSAEWSLVLVDELCGLMVSGIGRANAAGATAAGLSSRAFRSVINAGVAGALPGGGLQIGDVVVASRSVFFEEGIILPQPEGWRGLEMLGIPLIPHRRDLVDENAVRVDRQLQAGLLKLAGSGAREGSIATVARCSGTDAAASEVVARTGAIAEAMEGAAVLLAAHRMGVSQVAEVRVISNTCGDRQRQVWDLSAALGRLDELLRVFRGAIVPGD